jgi:hypothetical protein
MHDDDNRSLDEKLAPQDFVTDLVWAARALLKQPQVALVTIAFWCYPFILPIVRSRVSLSATVPVSLVLLLLMGGWNGAERLFFLRQHQRKTVTMGDLLRAAPRFVGRFARLGCLFALALSLVTLLSGYLLGLHAAVAGHASSASAPHWPVAIAVVLMDIVLTFVTSALVFTTRSARQALRIGWQMIRQTWPRSGLYVICPALALNLLNSIYPTQIQVVKVATTAGLALLAVLAKGATAAFYLRERPVVPEVVGDPPRVAPSIV